MDSLAELAADIKTKARALGFDLCGIAPAEPSGFKPQYLAWLAKGFHGEMGYLARDPDRRTDPNLVLPGAKSIISVAMNYYTESDADTDDPERAIFARYARGDDYHDVMTPRLKELLVWIKEVCPEITQQSDQSSVISDQCDGSQSKIQNPRSKIPTEGRVYVDTGPILEREMAQQAGLGWFGKNTMLINTRRGSYFLLGEILLNLPLPPDVPAVGQCGTCTRCLDACPTGAIVRPYELDATRCISYLTIELKGPIPDDLAPKIGNRIFGCDICQECCPFNRPAARSSHPTLVPTEEAAFQARAATSLRLSELAEMTVNEFREKFRKSPVKRAKWVGLRRNVEAGLSSPANQ